MTQSKILRTFSGALILAAALIGSYPPQNASGQTGSDQKNQMIQTRMERNIRHELIMLPYYSVFDNLEFKLKGDSTVVLTGQVVWAPLKDHAEQAVKELEEVKTVENNIEILPLLPYDNTIRRRVYEAIYNQNGFERYRIQAVPPIHIIVKNGRVTLEGVVDDEYDKNLAELAANNVSNVFQVTNNLKVLQRQ